MPMPRSNAISDSRIGTGGSILELIFYSGENCHLCQRLEAMVCPHLDELRVVRKVNYVKRNIADDPAWTATYRYRIPVVVCDGSVVLEGQPSAEEVLLAMRGLDKSTS